VEGKGEGKLISSVMKETFSRTKLIHRHKKTEKEKKGKAENVFKRVE
jgi:hypothetical protein